MNFPIVTKQGFLIDKFTFHGIFSKLFTKPFLCDSTKYRAKHCYFLKNLLAMHPS